MRIGFVGDIVGKPGRSILKERLMELRAQERIDILIANAENASHGFGMGKEALKEIIASGVDVITAGNHTWDKKEIISLFDTFPILRPLNFAQTAPGSGVGIYDVAGSSLAVVNIMGHYGMPMVDNPFTAIIRTIETLKEKGIKHIFVDFHAESTSEKRAMFWLLSGQVSAVIGTHTHVGTDDLEVAQGTLGLSDIGACGCMDGILGFEKDSICRRFVSSIPTAFEIPTQCIRMLPLVVCETNSDGKCVDGYKIRVIESQPSERILQAYFYS